MSKKNILTIIIVLVIIILAIVLINSKSESPVKQEEKNFEEEIISEEQGSLTKQEVPENITVPELNETPVDENVAVPLTVSQAAPGVTAMLRRFEIKAENDEFSPSEIIVNQNDTIHIDFTAVDKEYDMTLPDYGMKAVAAKGETKVFEFQAVGSGKFLYYCDSCGGIESKTQGHITILPKK
jgi:heme/copper-type cytochrome/quinol oxidase subunit 2